MKKVKKEKEWKKRGKNRGKKSRKGRAKEGNTRWKTRVEKKG